MTSQSLIILFFVVLICLFLSSRAATTATTTTKEIEYWFTQKLNHFDPQQNDETFQQRYYLFDEYYVPRNNNVILLYICGEGPCEGTPGNYAKDYAKELNALLITIEHRYYGKSIPQSFHNLSTSNLKYLSSQQALADLAHFISMYNKQQKQKFKWISIGCSYSGALSAWLRLKYPHLVVGALSSSGVVNTIVDFVQFDQQIMESAGIKCGHVLKRVTQAIENQFRLGGPQMKKYVKSLFQCSAEMSDPDFFFLIADSAAESIQYGFHDDLCSLMEPLYYSIHSKDDMLFIHTFANFTKNVFYKHFGEDSPTQYMTQYAQNISLAQSDSSVRQWNYQVCSEFGYFQNAPANNSIRSHEIDMKYQLDRCLQIYGQQLPVYDIFQLPTSADIYYGKDDISKEEKIIFTNGSQDPWKRASVKPNHPSYIEIKCRNCGHCVDLRGCPSLPNGDKPNDKCVEQGNEEAKRVRIHTINKFKQWLA
jgi:pimeloyl-ACP methyl ester carboxylesterase